MLRKIRGFDASDWTKGIILDLECGHTTTIKDRVLVENFEYDCHQCDPPKIVTVFAPDSFFNREGTR